jgi:hypothetical protein
MTVYVRRNGVLVNKATGEPVEQMALTAKGFPTPRIGHFDSFESPVTGDQVTSWRQRDREMNAHDCYDPRDMPPGHVYSRGREEQLKEVRANGQREPE